jgi:hypothetical protein
MTTTNIINTLDEMLKNDKTFDTRAGLRFMAELVKDAFEFIDEERSKNTLEIEKLNSYAFRIGNVETALNEFLTLRKREQDAAIDERKFYRRTVIGGIVMILIGQLIPALLSLFAR